MTLFGLAVRSHRTSMFVMSVMGALAGGLNTAGFIQLAGTTLAERAAFGRQMEVLGKQLSYLLPDPVQLDTLGGYLTWRAFGFLALVFALWAILAATGAGRGDEERGLTEQWLASGVSRLRWLATRAIGFAVAAAIALAVTLGVTALAAAGMNEPLPLDGLALEGIALLGVTLVSFGIGLAIAQLVVTRRAAGSIGAVAVIALHLVNSAGRSGLEVGALRDISPFSLLERSAPLLRGGVLDLGGTATLYVAAVVLVFMSTSAFMARDVGGPLLRLRTRTKADLRPSTDPLLRLPVFSMIDRGGLVGWTVALAGFAVFMTSIAKTIVDSLMTVTSMRVLFERLGVAAYTDFVGVMWFGTGLFILSGLAVGQVHSWAADDGEGRLEAALAAGASRSRIVVERIAALLVTIGIVAVVSSVVVFYVARALDIALPGGRMALATVLILPVILAFGGIGAAFVGWRPRFAVLLLGGVAVLSYFLQQFAAVFDWPEWVGRLSIYTLYGMPLSRDDWGGIATLIAIGLAGTAIALVAMQRRDVGT